MILDISNVTSSPDTRRPIELGAGAANDCYTSISVLWKRVSKRQQPLQTRQLRALYRKRF